MKARFGGIERLFGEAEGRLSIAESTRNIFLPTLAVLKSCEPLTMALRPGLLETRSFHFRFQFFSVLKGALLTFCMHFGSSSETT